MAITGIEEGKDYLCQEQSTGRANTGVFRIDSDRISVRFVSYDKDPGIRMRTSIVLRTEENWIVSLHDNIVSRPGSTHIHGATSYSQRVLSNSAIVGHSPWQTSDLVRKIDFRIVGADEVLLHSEKHRELSKADPIDVDNILFSLKLSDAKIQVWYGYSLDTHDDHAKDVWPGFVLEFDNAVSIPEARRYVQKVVKFFAAVVGQFLWATDFSISKLSSAEEQAAFDAKEPVRPHRYFEITTKSEPSDDKAWAGSLFGNVLTDRELSALTACLKEWVERDAIWDVAANLMMGSFSLNKNRFDSARLLAATKWLEKIPGAASLPVMSKNEIDDLSSMIGKLAEERGLGDLSSRFAGAIKGISKETRTQQHSRLVQSVGRKFGPNFLNHDIVSYLNEANNFRGIAAHTQMSMESDSEFSKFCKSVYALECLCYLLTIKDLPIGPEGRARLDRHPIIRSYESSWVADDTGKRI